MIEADTTVLRRLVDKGGDWLGEIQFPVLLTGSIGDEFLPDIPAQATLMVLQIPDCSIFLTNYGGHPLMWTRVPVFRQIADNFLASLIGRVSVIYQDCG